MSSTNRGGQRMADDYYSSPASAVDAILERLGSLAGKRILEPSAGTGAIINRLRQRVLDCKLAADTHPYITAVEIDSERAAELRKIDHLMVIEGNFVTQAFARPYDLIVMNPPYSEALAHVERAISLLTPEGTCAALLRLAFCCSKKRAPFRAAHPFDLYPLASRPSFTGGQTDSADYAWFCFGHGRGGCFDVLETHP